jgi:hypothetical protein
MPKTKALLVDLSYMPVSIVVVGLGKEDFTKMNELNSEIIVDAEGRRSARSCVSFVKFSSEVLQAVPQ